MPEVLLDAAGRRRSPANLLSTLHKDMRPMKDTLEAILVHLRSFAAPADR